MAVKAVKFHDTLVLLQSVPYLCSHCCKLFEVVYMVVYMLPI